jgi:hypothetical protein
MVQMIKALILGSLAIATCTLAARDLLERRSLYTVSSGSARTPIVLDALNPSMNQFGYTGETNWLVMLIAVHHLTRVVAASCAFCFSMQHAQKRR